MTSSMLSPVVFWLSILFLWVLVYWLYRDYRVDLFRQRLFDIRARLFDAAGGADLPYDDPAYVRLRTLLNGFIRYGDRLNVPTTAALFWAFRDAESPERGAVFERDWIQALERLDQPLSQLLSELRTNMHFEVGKQIFLASPLSFITIVPLVLLLLIHLATTRLVGAAVRRGYRVCADYFRRTLLTPLDSIAFQFGTNPSLVPITSEHMAVGFRQH